MCGHFINGRQWPPSCWSGCIRSSPSFPALRRWWWIYFCSLTSVAFPLQSSVTRSTICSHIAPWLFSFRIQRHVIGYSYPDVDFRIHNCIGTDHDLNGAEKTRHKPILAISSLNLCRPITSVPGANIIKTVDLSQFYSELHCYTKLGAIPIHGCLTWQPHKVHWETMETVNVEGFLSSEPAATITSLLKFKSSSRRIVHGFKLRVLWRCVYITRLARDASSASTRFPKDLIQTREVFPFFPSYYLPRTSVRPSLNLLVTFRHLRSDRPDQASIDIDSAVLSSTLHVGRTHIKQWIPNNVGGIATMSLTFVEIGYLAFCLEGGLFGELFY